MKSILKSIGYIIAYALFQLIVIMIISPFAILFGANSETKIAEFMVNNTLLVIILTNFVAVTAFAIFRKARKHPKIKLFDFRNIIWKDCMLCAIITFAFSMCFSLITYHISFENGQSISQSATYYSQRSSLLGISIMVIAVLVSAPITEEYICRGILFSELQKEFSPAIVIILSGAIFGVMHLFGGGIVLTIGATLMGMLFGYIYWMTKSLTVAALAHSCANLPDFVFGFLPDLNIFTRSIMAFVFLIIAAGCVLYFQKRQPASAA